MLIRNYLKPAPLILLALTAVFAGSVPRAQACSCPVTSLQAQYMNSDDMVVIHAIAELAAGEKRLYLATIERTFKGCLSQGEFVLITTPASSAACGVTLPPEPMLITASQLSRRYGLKTLQVSLCGYNVPLDSLSDSDKAFLESRNVCCGDECQCADGSEPVQCFADPCQVAKPCAEAVCVSNYCGGCNAEFYHPQTHEPMCQGAGSCADDADCPSGLWCREAEPAADGSSDGTMECVPFASEGESCEGFTLPWLYERCAPDLQCVTPPNVADAPGICQPQAAGCYSDKDCADDEHCNAGEVCLPPPGCGDGRICPAVCYGQCVAD